MADGFHRLRQAGVGEVGQFRDDQPERVAATGAQRSRGMRGLKIIVARGGQDTLLRRRRDSELLGPAIEHHACRRTRDPRHAGDIVDS